MVLSVRNSEISLAVMEPFMSCLLARMRIDAFCRSYKRQDAEGYPWCHRKKGVEREKNVPTTPLRTKNNMLSETSTC